ncbi:hypothetical protein KCU76_g13415, partial [Aureobasidium melanogenum]
QPMYESKQPQNSAVANGVPTPSTTPPPEAEAKSMPKKELPMRAPPFTADLPEGSSPKLVAADSTNGTPDEEIKRTVKQDEDAADDSKDREGDIYADAVLACSIENPEACIMCSG